MKNLLIFAMFMVSLLFLNSCGINYAVVSNENQNSTQVHLSTNNYQVVESVTGSEDVNYVLIFGGMNRRQLYENAYTNMIKQANLMSGSKALINIVTEEHIGGFPPIFYKRTITVSAHVIEFSK